MSSSISKAGVRVKAILQQCISARLQVEPQTEHVPAKYVEVGRGLVIYICFLQGTTEDLVDKMVKNAMSCRLSRQDAENGDRLVSIVDLPGDVLIVPQATLGGKMKGKAMQYHENIAKDTGRSLYERFVSGCQRTLEENASARENDCTVKHGTYGNLQVLHMDTNGPYTHVLEL